MVDNLVTLKHQTIRPDKPGHRFRSGRRNIYTNHFDRVDPEAAAHRQKVATSRQAEPDPDVAAALFQEADRGDMALPFDLSKWYASSRVCISKAPGESRRGPIGLPYDA